MNKASRAQSFAAVHAPWADAFNELPICGEPAVDYHGQDHYKVYLCAHHWDQYVTEEAKHEY